MQTHIQVGAHVGLNSLSVHGIGVVDDVLLLLPNTSVQRSSQVLYILCPFQLMAERLHPAWCLTKVFSLTFAAPTGNLLASTDGTLVYLDFGMMSEAPQYARYAIMAHVVHLVNRDYEAMCKDYYTLQFMDPSIDTRPIAPALQVCPHCTMHGCFMHVAILMLQDCLRRHLLCRDHDGQQSHHVVLRASMRPGVL